MPQPDLALLRPRADFYTGSLTQASDTLLVVEVVHSSLAKDREVKLPLYAGAGIPEVWLFTEEGMMEVHREPKGRRYRLRLTLEPGEETAPLALGDPPFRWDPPTGTPPA